MNPYERLLRWYPRVWRQAHGEVLLALLRDADDDAGRTHPTRSDAWAVRIHGTAERLSPTAGWALATAGTLVSLVSVVNVFALLGSTGRAPLSGWALLIDPQEVVQLLAAAAAPALVSLAVAALLRSVGSLSAPASVVAGASACAAWCLAALTSASLGAGFQRLAADLHQTPLGAATPVLFSAAIFIGTVAAAFAWDGILAVVPALRSARGGPGSPVVVRRLVAAALGVVSALLLGMAAFVPWSTFLAGAAVAAACLLRSHRTSSPTITRHHARPPLVADGRRASAAGQLALSGLTMGTVGLALVAMGPVWREQLQLRGVLEGVPGFFSDGWALSSTAGALTALAVGLVVVPRWGRRTRLLVGAVCAALVLQVLATVINAFVTPGGGPLLWPLLGGGLLMGLAAAAPLPQLLPGGAVVRWSTAALLAAATGLTLGASLLVAVPLVTPLAASAVLLALLVSASRVRRPAPEAGHGATGMAASS